MCFLRAVARVRHLLQFPALHRNIATRKLARPGQAGASHLFGSKTKTGLNLPSKETAQAVFFMVRPAWAHTCGCKSRRKLVTTSEAKYNCVRVTERGKEVRSVNREPMNKNRIEGAAKQGERAMNRKALVTKARWRRCGGCAMKVCDPYLGRSRLAPERATALPEREVSRGRSSHSRGRGGQKATAKD